MPRTVLHWFRRDLRLTDNTSLHHAAQAAGQVIPVYILSDWKQHHIWTGPNRQQFLCDCLASLARNLASLGSRLILRCGSAAAELERLIHETRAEAVYFNRDYDPFGRAMESKVRELCTRLGIECHAYQDSVMHEPEAVLPGSTQPYRIFTPYSKNWINQPKTTPQGRIQSLGPSADETIMSLPPPTLAHWQLPACIAQIPAPGERAARDRMKRFIDSGILRDYAQQRNIPAGPCPAPSQTTQTRPASSEKLPPANGRTLDRARPLPRDFCEA
jgi:deoxyribodipyrimidine photo-lyase